MKKIISYSLICLLYSLATPAMAAESLKQCNKETSIKKKSRCFDVIIEKVDRELQTWINSQTFNLEELALRTGRKSALSMFKRAQNDFIRFRENNCRWQYLAISPDISASNAYKKCYIILTKNRIKELSQVEPVKINRY